MHFPRESPSECKEPDLNSNSADFSFRATIQTSTPRSLGQDFIILDIFGLLLDTFIEVLFLVLYAWEQF